MTTVREFSTIGPCLTVGESAGETEKSLLYFDGNKVRRVKKSWRYHVEPCVSCRDHPRTQYPEGYMD